MIVRTGDDGGSYAYAFDKPFDFSTIRFEEKVASNSLHQPQPEAVAYDFTNVEAEQVGRAIWHISEQGEGNQPLEYVRCKASTYQVRDIEGTYRAGELP